MKSWICDSDLMSPEKKNSSHGEGKVEKRDRRLEHAKSGTLQRDPLFIENQSWQPHRWGSTAVVLFSPNGSVSLTLSGPHTPTK